MISNPSQAILNALQEGKTELKGEFMWGSNYTFLLQIEHKDLALQAVYKPTRGVRPLWDFSTSSLARREVAAYLVSTALEWNLVPPTVLRRDGPFGPGSIQQYIDHNPEYHYFNFTQSDRQRLRPVALFDLLSNNADRKGSHVLIDPNGRIWLIDHGICFHTEDKLRTVIWDFAGEPIPDDLCAELARFRQKLAPVAGEAEQSNSSDLAATLKPYLTQSEILALAHRVDHLLATGCFPNPDQSRRQHPWPPV